MVEHTHLLIHNQVESWIVLGALTKADSAVFVYDTSHFEDGSGLELVGGTLDLYDLDLTACGIKKVSINYLLGLRLTI